MRRNTSPTLAVLSALERAIDRMGTASALARMIGVKPQSVHQWRTGRAEITGERAIDIERATDGYVRREHIRPDLFKRDNKPVSLHI